MLSKYAILLDGGFVTKKLLSKLGRFPKAADVCEPQRVGSRNLLKLGGLIARSSLAESGLYPTPTAGPVILRNLRNATCVI